MNFNRVANKVAATYIMDPYSMLMHYKRAFKLMQLLKDNKAKVLILGNKNQFGIDWKGRFEGIDFDTGVVDEMVISSAPKHYQMVLCLDPVLYVRALRKISLPVMMCATAREITQHPEILDVTDYLLPSPSSRHDAALRQLIAEQVMKDGGGQGAGKGAEEEKAEKEEGHRSATASAAGRGAEEKEEKKEEGPRSATASAPAPRAGEAEEREAEEPRSAHAAAPRADAEPGEFKEAERKEERDVKPPSENILRQGGGGGGGAKTAREEE